MIELVSVDGTATSIVSLAEAKAHLRVDGTLDDSYITGLISAAIEYVEQETGRDYLEKTWNEVLPCFPSHKIELLRPPLKTVEAITYYDSDGTQQEADDTQYIVRKPHFVSGYVVPAPNYLWPCTQADRDNAVTITYTTSPTVIPETLKQAVKLLIGLYYENRENFEAGKVMTTGGIDRLIDQLRHGGYY